MDISIGLLREAFLQRVKNDEFSDLEHGNRPSSIYEFVDYLTIGNVAMRRFGLSEKARFPDLTNLRMTFSEFLSQCVQLDGRQVVIGEIFREYFCGPLVTGLVSQVVRDSFDNSVTNAALSEIGVTTWREWAREMERSDRIERVTTELYETACSVLANRPLISFFITSPVAGQFSMWGPHASSGVGRKLKTQVVLGDGYSVAVNVSKYEEVECNVTAYEWQATLTMDNADESDAAACGMIYVFDRVDGRPVGGLSDLIMAADSLADADVIQAQAFIRMHNDAANVIEQSDLCFVWIWERRGGTEKGLGLKCLIPALQDLRRRFKKIRTVVFDARPGQFATWTSKIDPPMVAVEKQAALDNLVSYIQNLTLDADVRAIFAGSNDSFTEALVALGQALDVREGCDDDDASSIDWDTWQEEIEALFRLAGLEVLADEMADGTVVYEEAEIALKHLVFDPNVQYVRVSRSSTFNPMMLGIEPIPHEVAHEQIEGFDEFCAHLPANMHITSVDNPYAYIICTVCAETPFGELIEYFTLVPKPRPINIESFFRNLN